MLPKETVCWELVPEKSCIKKQGIISLLQENCHHVLMQLQPPTDPTVQKLTAAYWTSFC
jgi:hypothetical protein